MKKEYYLSILSGQQRGILAALIRPFLSVLTCPYSVILSVRYFLYKCGVVKSTKLPVDVISVGNITMGGTGKTPLVELLAKDLQRNGKKVAILSRGYGGYDSNLENGNTSNDNVFKNDGLINDEFLVLKENLRETPVLLGKDRVQSGERAIRDYGVDCLILDDGFQHLKLKRDLDIVVIDTLNSISDDFLIPRGTLRGPLKDLNRADLFILSHCDLCDDQTLKTIYTKLRYINADIPICETVHKPVHIENIKDNSIEKPEWLRGKRVYVLCAIGNPESFKSTLTELGADVIRSRVYRDHHSYLQRELDEVVDGSESLGLDAIVVTQKDIVKIRGKNIGNANFMSLKIEMQITKGAEFYEGAIARIMSTNDVN